MYRFIDIALAVACVIVLALTVIQCTEADVEQDTAQTAEAKRLALKDAEERRIESVLREARHAAAEVRQ